jgi:hypothetical protein
METLITLNVSNMQKVYRSSKNTTGTPGPTRRANVIELSEKAAGKSERR